MALYSTCVNVGVVFAKTNTQIFMGETEIWFKRLIPILNPFIGSKTIEMLQIDNEYGFWRKDSLIGEK